MSDDHSPSALLVLGMHRSGTSALTGVLRLCGASPGDSAQLTETSIENHKGFWERRDVRQVCDALLHAAGADWWKIANLHLDAIPHAVLHEQRRKFQYIISELNQSPVWILKEPRLCLLLPLLVDYIRRPTCIHVVRNPLEVAQSLHVRNGFATAAGLALWEAYNLHALHASANLPRTFVSYNALISDPTNTLSQLIRNLHDLSVAPVTQPTPLELSGFLDSTLYRQKATLRESEEHLSPSQERLWQALLSGDVSLTPTSRRLSPAALRHLFDLESTELSLQHHKLKLHEYRETLTKRTATIERCDAQLDEYRKALAKRTATIERRDAQLEEYRDTVAKRTATIERRDAQLDEYRKALAKRAATIERRDAQISAMHRSLSWRITAPLRAIHRLLIPTARKSPTEAQEQPVRPHSPSDPPKRRSSILSSSIEQPSTTYVIPASWWDAHPDAARDISNSGQTILLMGSTELPIAKKGTRVDGPKARSLALFLMGSTKLLIDKNITRVDGPKARLLALAAVTTRTVIEVDPGAAPSLVAWGRWKSSAEKGEQREGTNVRMRTAESIVNGLVTECTSQRNS